MAEDRLGVFYITMYDPRFDEDSMATIMMGMKGLNGVSSSVYAYAMIPGEVHLLVRQRESGIAGSVAFFMDRCFGEEELLYNYEAIRSAEAFLAAFRRLARLPVMKDLCDRPGEYPYGSWVNDYQGMCSITVCHTRVVLRRFGFDTLYETVNAPQADLLPSS